MAGISTPKPSRNRIFVIRHGESESNVQGVLVSDPKDGVSSYGLTDRGKQQATEAAAKLKALLESEASLKDRLMIISSDFKRARETAEILHENLQPKTPIRFEIALREREFGVLNLAPDCGLKIQEIYDKEILDATQSPYGAECIMNVVLRMSRLVQNLEEENNEKIIILVSHADPLQILTAPLFGVAPNEHSKYLPWFDNCDIRELKDMTA